MGQPEGDFSDYNTDQPQEYDPQAYQYDASQGQEDPTANTFDQGSYDPNQQDQTNTAKDPQAQQQPQQGQYQPQPRPFHQQQPQQYPQQRQQVNPGFGPGPRQGQPMQYPPQNSPMYPPQGRPYQPVNFPPQSPQANPMFVPQAQPGFSPGVPQGYQVPQSQPVQYPPPQSPLQQQPPYNIPNSPIKPSGNMAAPGVPVQMTQQAYNQGWKTGLFDCMDDPMNALITAFFPCVTFGQVAEIVDNGNTSCGTSGMLYGLIAFCIAMPCIMSCSYRTKLRARFGLMESPAPDWVTHFFCEYCALCQEYRELNLRGIDPSIGWQGNMAMQMQQPQIAMVAPPNQRMMP